MVTTFLALGAVFAFLAVVCGAFGAHALGDRLSSDMMAIYETAVQYHMYHALGLILIGILGQYASTTWINWAGGFLTAGIIIFSGSLYILSFTGKTWLGAVTPIGGVAFLAGWIFVLVAIFQR